MSRADAASGVWTPMSPENPIFRSNIETTDKIKFLTNQELAKCFLPFNINRLPDVAMSAGQKPGLGCVLLSGHHACNVMPSRLVGDEVQAYFSFRENLPRHDTWCEFSRISNSECVAQLAYAEFIEIIEKYFITGGHDLNVDEILGELNESIRAGFTH